VIVALKRDDKGEHETPVEKKFVGGPILRMLQLKQRFIFFATKTTILMEGIQAVVEPQEFLTWRGLGLCMWTA
jgi:hypothetical protein